MIIMENFSFLLTSRLWQRRKRQNFLLAIYPYRVYNIKEGGILYDRRNRKLLYKEKGTPRKGI